MNSTILMSLLISLLMVIAVLEVFRIVQWRKRESVREASIRTLQDDVKVLFTGANGIGNHLESLEQKVKRLSERQSTLDMRDPVTHTYGHAIKLVQRGANIEDIIANCGIPRGEAELLLNLHRNNRVTS